MQGERLGKGMWILVISQEVPPVLFRLLAEMSFGGVVPYIDEICPRLLPANFGRAAEGTLKERPLTAAYGVMGIGEFG